ncbi:bifunctional metallophosphatase/5'-nucleotidase [Psychromonas sp. PT13]|uniref:bifunctional metallophosphatase/5'-nucleotidase n=1 Tax=Psychromonas sp. PT13 TaxID=3439547 RepID=UPI003EBD55A6
MKKVILLILSLIWVGNVFAVDNKAYIVFSAGLNEIDDPMGSYAELASLLSDYRATQTPTFFVFGGNSLFPSTLSSFDHGAHIIDLLNTLEPDAMAANKGDFAFSVDELSLRSYEAAFPIVQSNVIGTGSKKRIEGITGSAIMVKGDYRIGFISLMDRSDIESYNLQNVTVQSIEVAVSEKVKSFRDEGVDFVVLHYAGNEFNCVEFLEKGMVDIVLRNPPHVTLSKQVKLQQHPRQIFVSDKDKAAVIEFSWDTLAHKKTQMHAQLKRLSDYPKFASVEQQIQDYSRHLDLLLDDTIGITTTPIDLSRKNLRVKENGFGNLLADLMKAHTGADVAIMNSGAIRGEGIYKANSRLSRGDIIKALPYRDRVVLLNVNGAQILSALENGFSEIEGMKGRFPQITGMQVTYNSKGRVGHRIISIMINNQPLELQKQYKLATTPYIANGGDGYNMFKDNIEVTYAQQMTELLSDILINKLRLNHRISPKVNARIIDTASVKSSIN